MPLKFDNLKSPPAIAWVGIPFLLGLLLDLWTKHLAMLRLAPPDDTLPAQGYSFIPGWLHFTYVRNFGAVFGAGEGYRWVFVVVSVAAILAVLAMFAGSGRRRWYQVLLGMLLAGIVGNLYDRLTYGFVRDMIHGLPHFYWGGTWVIPVVNYPARDRALFPWVFNVADSLLCVSIGALILHGIIYPDKPKAQGHHNDAA